MEEEEVECWRVKATFAVLVYWVDESALSDNETAEDWFRDIYLERFLQSISDDVMHPPLLPAEQPSELCLTDLGFDDFRRLEPGTHGRT